MTTPHALAAQLQSMNIASNERPTHAEGVQATHVLTFRSPAVELLPPGTKPFFAQPTNMRSRQYPTETGSQRNVIDTTFFAVFSVGDEEHPFDAVEGAYGDYKRLIRAINNLKLRSGNSKLSAVVYDSIHENATFVKLKYRFRLETGDTSPQDFELDEDQWDCLGAFEDEQEWIEVLFDLVRQGSERAVLETRKVLYEAYGEKFTNGVELGWSYQWLLKRPRTIEALFRAHFFPAYYDVSLVFDKPGDAKIDAKLECGHYVEVRKIWIASIQGQDCLMQKCPHCGRRIMTTPDEKQLQLGEEWDGLEQYRKETESWQELGALPPFDSPKLFDCKSLLNALWVALESFDMPETVCPTSMCPSNFAETQSIKEALLETFCSDGVALPLAWTSKPADLCGELTVMAHEAVSRENLTNRTPGLEAFVNAWMLRAVNLLTHRPCTGRGKRHLGIHKHKHVWCFNSNMSADQQDEAENEDGETDVEEMMDELQGQMEEATMEDDFSTDD